MGIFDRDEMSGHDFNMRYDQKYYDRAVADQQRQGAAQWIRDNQAMMMGQQATPAMRRPSVEAGQEVLGSPEQMFPMPNNAMQGQSIADIEQPAQEATGFIGGEPSREFLEARNQAMIGSGYQSLMDQGFSNSKSTMDSVNSGINAIRGKRFDVTNREPADRKMYQAADGFKYWQDTNERVNPNALMKESTPLVQVGLGGERSRIVSDEDKGALGLDSTVPYFWNKQGIPTPVKRTNYTESHLQSAGYANRMHEASDRINKILDRGHTPGSLRSDLTEAGGPIGNYFMPSNDQEFNQAKHDWVRAKLRKESGAVIGDDEMAKEIATYFPKAGDGEAVIKRKAESRRIAEDAMILQAGGAYKRPTELSFKELLDKYDE